MASDIERKIISMYTEDRLSGVEIAKNLGLHFKSVYRWLEKNKVKRRTPEETNAIQYLNKSPSFRIKREIKGDDLILLTSGIMLYWAEGAKYANKHTLDLANSDPVMIRVFLKFLRKVCGIQEGKIRIYLYCYANQNPESLKRFWSKLTKVSLKQFTKPYVRQDFKEDKIGKMPYGLIHVRYFDKKLYIQFEQWQQFLLKKIFGGVAE